MGHRTTVHVEKRLLTSPALLVNPSCHYAFPGTGFAKDDDLRITDGCLLSELERGSDGRALADELERRRWRQHAAQRRVLSPQTTVLHRPRERFLDEGGFHGLSEVVEGAEPHRLDTVVVVRLPGEHHNLAGQPG